MRAIWAHGAAQGVWKDIANSVDDGSEETCLSKVEVSVISMMADIPHRREMRMRRYGDLINLFWDGGKNANNPYFDDHLIIMFDLSQYGIVKDLALSYPPLRCREFQNDVTITTNPDWVDFKLR